MPMKVSPKCYIQLCQRVNILHKEKRKAYYLSPSEKDEGKFIIKSPSKRDRRNTVNPGQKTGLLTICMYTNKPGSKERAYDLGNQSHRTGDNTSI